MNILLIHPGHSYSTGDVFDGMKAGLEANGVAVTVYDTWKNAQLFNRWGGVVAHTMGEAAGGSMYRLGTWLASADTLSLAIDQAVDAVIVINGLLFPYERAGVLRKLGIPVACYGTEAPYYRSEERALAPHYSHWFTNERRSVKDYSDLTRCTYLPHAWNPALHVPGPAVDEQRCDVAFVGGGFPERKALLNGVDWTGINLQKRGTLWNGETDLSAGAIPNTETRAWHQSATIALNLHRRMTRIDRPGEMVAAAAVSSLGPRAYEIPACGGFMLCDDERPEIYDVFGESAATFAAWDSESLARAVRYWLSHDDERERVRDAQHAAIQAHSWTHRASTMLADLFA